MKLSCLFGHKWTASKYDVEMYKTGIEYAVNILEVQIMEEYYSDMDKFLYAPDNLFVEGYPVTWERKNGMLIFDYEHRTLLKVKTLVPSWVTISNE
jgi:hypothetical protein